MTQPHEDNTQKKNPLVLVAIRFLAIATHHNFFFFCFSSSLLYMYIIWLHIRFFSIQYDPLNPNGCATTLFNWSMGIGCTTNTSNETINREAILSTVRVNFRYVIIPRMWMTSHLRCREFCALHSPHQYCCRSGHRAFTPTQKCTVDRWTGPSNFKWVFFTRRALSCTF